MTTFQARFFLLGFVLLAAAITYNAAYRQVGSHPTPMSADEGSGKPAQEPARKVVPRIAKTLPRHNEPVVAAKSSDTVQSIQRHLTDQGYEPGPVDGLMGDQTRAAIMAYEHDRKMQVTGDAAQRLLKSMILGGSPGETKIDPNYKLPTETASLVKSIQQTLSKLGYDPGPVDGLIGASTGNAIRKFERDHKLPVKGRICGRVVKELKDASGGRLSVIASN